MADVSHRDFANRLASVMKERALSQGDLAELVGVSTATVWGWLNESLPQRRTAHALGLKLDVSPRWLINGEGTRRPFDKGPAADMGLAIAEQFEKVDIITARNEGQSLAYKKAAADLRALATSFEKRRMKAAAKSVRKLALRYEGFDLSEDSKRELSRLAQELIRRISGARSQI